MTTTTCYTESATAEQIVRHLEQVAAREQLEEFAAQDGGDLSQFRSLIETRTGCHVEQAAWDEAMDLIRERYEE